MIEFDFVKSILSEQKDFRLARDTKKEFRLVEDQSSVAGRSGVIQNIIIDETDIDDFQLYKFDLKTPDPFPFLNLNNNTLPSGVRSFCDYFAICSYEDIFYIVLFELKTIDKLDNYGSEAKKAIPQLIAGEEFAKFVLGTADRCKSENTKNFKTSRYSIGNCQFPTDNVLKLITVSVLKTVMVTNPRKSARPQKITQKAGNLFNGVSNISDTLVLKDLLSQYTKQKPTH